MNHKELPWDQKKDWCYDKGIRDFWKIIPERMQKFILPSREIRLVNPEICQPIQPTPLAHVFFLDVKPKKAYTYWGHNKVANGNMKEPIHSTKFINHLKRLWRLPQDSHQPEGGRQSLRYLVPRINSMLKRWWWHLLIFGRGLQQTHQKWHIWKMKSRCFQGENRTENICCYLYPRKWHQKVSPNSSSKVHGQQVHTNEGIELNVSCLPRVLRNGVFLKRRKSMNILMKVCSMHSFNKTG